MEYIPIIILVIILGFIVKSALDLFYSKILTKSEKVNMAFVIVIMPVLGSIIFYIYHHNKYLALRGKRKGDLI